MEKLTRSVIQEMKKYGDVGKCGICGRMGLKSTRICPYLGMWEGIPDSIHKRFGLTGTHVMYGQALRYPDGTRAPYNENGKPYVETPMICKTCDKKHFEQSRNNTEREYGYPLTEKAKQLVTIEAVK